MPNKRARTDETWLESWAGGAPQRASFVAKHAKAHRRSVARLCAKKKTASRSGRGAASLTSGKKLKAGAMMRKGKARAKEAPGPKYTPKIFQKPAAVHLSNQKVSNRISVLDLARLDVLMLHQIFVDLGILPDLRDTCSVCGIGDIEPAKQFSRGNEMSIVGASGAPVYPLILCSRCRHHVKAKSLLTVAIATGYIV